MISKQARPELRREDANFERKMLTRFLKSKYFFQKVNREILEQSLGVVERHLEASEVGSLFIIANRFQQF